VFHRADGRPLRARYALSHFHLLCERAGVPGIALHDLRRLTAAIFLTGGVPPVIVSKMLRHSTLSTTANVHGHLTAQAARQAVDHVGRVLDQAGPAPRRPAATTPRPPWDRDRHQPAEPVPWLTGGRGSGGGDATTLRPPGTENGEGHSRRPAEAAL
jgi:integrase